MSRRLEIQGILNSHKSIGCIIDLKGRYQALYTSPCNGVVSHGAQIGGIRVHSVPGKINSESRDLVTRIDNLRK